LEAYRQVQDEEINVLRNGQAVAHSNIQLLMEFSTRLTAQLSQSHDCMMRQMAEQAEALRLHMDACLASFAQTVEAPVQHVVQAFTTAANMASELAGQYAGMQEDMLRTLNAATVVHQASEFARTEALQQAQVSQHNLDLATAAITQVRHKSASSRAQMEMLTAHLVSTQLDQGARQPSTEEAQTARASRSSPSEFATWFNALLGSPVHPHVRIDSRPSPPSPTRQQSPERTRVFNNPFPTSLPIPTPSALPQMIVIQRPAVELLSHVPTYNGESTASAISFLGDAENAKRNEPETTRRMIIA
jgi:hypothetical protein